MILTSVPSCVPVCVCLSLFMSKSSGLANFYCSTSGLPTKADLPVGRPTQTRRDESDMLLTSSSATCSIYPNAKSVGASLLKALRIRPIQTQSISSDAFDKTVHTHYERVFLRRLFETSPLFNSAVRNNRTHKSTVTLALEPHLVEKW